jgi:hypothetical protein
MVMGIGILIILGAAWLSVIGVAVAGSIALTTAEYEPPSDSPFHRFILALARSRQREAQRVINRYRARAATMPQGRDRSAAGLPPALSSERGGVSDLALGACFNAEAR